MGRPKGSRNRRARTEAEEKRLKKLVRALGLRQEDVDAAPPRAEGVRITITVTPETASWLRQIGASAALSLTELTRLVTLGFLRRGKGHPIPPPPEFRNW